ncbi:hypothetical protein SBV1_2490015 [Verrucomicrobia bacterium]|nr:hypothetical protein SBV1_2490015 [Verrucomicrobiota bacterium]
MGLATDLYRFFNPLTAQTTPGPNGSNQINFRTVGDFLGAHPQHNGRLLEAVSVCGRLIDAGILARVGGRPGPELLTATYMSIPRAVQNVDYGTCDFLAFGFPVIRQHFGGAVRPVVVETLEGAPDIGSGFLLRDRYFVTAAHCIRDAQRVEIRGWLPGKLSLQGVYFSGEQRCDVAVLAFSTSPLLGVPGFDLGEPSILDDVLVMGYPPHPRIRGTPGQRNCTNCWPSPECPGRDSG